MTNMRGDDRQPDAMFSYVSAEQRVPKDRPLRAIRALVDDVLRDVSREFDQLYARVGRPSIPPERLLWAQLLQVFYSIRSERLLMEQLDYNLLFCWFVGMEVDEPIWARRCSRRIEIRSTTWIHMNRIELVTIDRFFSKLLTPVLGLECSNRG